MGNKSLKIILFDGSFKTTAFINRLAKGLAAKHEVYILGFNEELKQPVPRVKYVPLGSNQNKLKFLLTALSYGFQSKKLGATFSNLLKGNRAAIQKHNLEVALKRINPDIIHLQWTSVIPPFESFLNSGKIPFILSQRGFHTNVKPFVYLENMEYLRKWYPKFAGFHSVSKAITENGDKIWSSPNKMDRVVYTGLDFEAWSFSENYQKTTPLKILSVGRTHWKKGYDYALRTCHILKDKNIPFEYTIIGAAGEEELQFLRYDLDLQKEVTFLDRIPLEEVKNHMRNAAVMILPSLEEGLPNVAVEAMAIGLPVISFAIDGIPELITHEKEGWLVPPRDVHAMADAIEKFATLSESEIQTVRLQARKKVEHQHNEQQMVEGMERLYEEVLEKMHAIRL